MKFMLSYIHAGIVFAVFVFFAMLIALWVVSHEQWDDQIPAPPKKKSKYRYKILSFILALGVFRLLMGQAYQNNWMGLGVVVVGQGPGSNGGSMCAQIASQINGAAVGVAMGALTGKTVTLDARGFTGTQICPANDASTMFDGLRSTSNRGGKLLLGNVNLYVDGPSTSNFVDALAFNSQVNCCVGTRAIGIPSNFSIEGLGRGSSNGTTNAPSNTVIGLCLGPNNPKVGCTTGPPSRSFAISGEVFYTSATPGNSTATGTCTPNNAATNGTSGAPNFCAMIITQSTTAFSRTANGSDSTSTNVYIKDDGTSGEAFAIINTQATPADFPGMFYVNTLCTGAGTGIGTNAAIKAKCPDAFSIIIPVPAGTVACSTHCGNMVFGTPLIAMDPPSGDSYTGDYAVAGKASFGQSLKGVALDDGSSVNGIVAVRNTYGQEIGTMSVNILNLSYLGFDTATSDYQNYGPIGPFQASVGGSNTACGPHTTFMFLHSVNPARAVSGLTATADACDSSAGANRAQFGLILDDNDQIIADGHMEGFGSDVVVGKDNATNNVLISNFSGGPSTHPSTTVIELYKTFQNGDYDIAAIDLNGGTNTICDDRTTLTLVAGVAGNCITDHYTSHLAVDFLSDNVTNSIICSSPSCFNKYATGLSSALFFTNTNCAVNSASPAACGASANGAVVVPTTTTTYTVNTTAVRTHSRIFLQPISFASDLPSSPTCVAPAAGAVTISAIVSGTSFTFALPSTTGQTCWEYWVINQ